MSGKTTLGTTLGTSLGTSLGTTLGGTSKIANISIKPVDSKPNKVVQKPVSLKPKKPQNSKTNEALISAKI